MHSIICFGSFLFLLNIPPLWWFVFYSNNLDGYKESFLFFAILTIVLFALHIICFILYCLGVDGNLKSLKSRNKEGFVCSLLIIFAVLFLLDFCACISSINVGQGSSIILIALIPVTVLILITYCIYSKLYSIFFIRK